MKEIKRYFPDLSEKQYSQLEQLLPLYREWNEKINVISRKDIDNLYTHHVLHSLSISKIVKFVPGADILDLGTGGGFPGIPLSIIFPETNFMLIDGTLKKLKVVEAVVEALELTNVKVLQRRVEEMKMKRHFDFVLSRAVAKIDKLYYWSRPLLKKQEKHAIPNGLIALKGGNIKEELKMLPKRAYIEKTNLSSLFSEQYFEEKCILYVQAE